MELTLANLPITVEQLLESDQLVLTLANSLYENREYRKAFDLTKKLEPLVEQLPESSALRFELQKSIYRLRCLALHLLPDDYVFQLFENGIIYGLLDGELPLIERVKYRLSNIELGRRDEFRRALLRHFERNQQILTSLNPTVDNRIVPGTIANWFLDYRQKVGGDSVSLIERAEYITNDQNVKKLVPIERQSINRMIDLVEYLKLSSYTPEGFEESVLFVDDFDGHLKLFENGIGIDLGPTVTTSSAKPEIPLGQLTNPKKGVSTEKLPITTVERTGVDEAAQTASPQSPLLDRLRSKFKGDTAALRQEFYHAVQKKDRQGIVAILYVLAEHDDLLSFITDDKKLNSFLAVVWQKEYGSMIADQFKQNPVSPQSIRLFLRYILEQRLGMSETDAAKLGVQLANVFVSQGKKEYTELAYFDMTSKQFRWF
jgi:hypothetical protein